jgi:hypothetical protein
MNKFWKSINSVFLIGILMLSLVPLAFADNDESQYDVNQDGTVDEDDFQFCGEFSQAGTYNDRCDFNDDGLVGLQDLVVLTQAIGNTNLIPDLVVEDITFSPSSPDEQDDVYVNVLVKNNGESSAENFWIGLYEFYGAEQVTSEDASGASSAKTTSGYTLAAGESMKKTFGPYKFTEGQHTMMAWVDMFNNVEESNENNNVRYETVSVGEATGTNIIFKDDFSGPPTEWTMVLNTIATTTPEPGVLRLYYLGEGEHNMLFVNKNPGTDDYAVTAKVAVFPKPDGDYASSDTRAVGVIARYQDADNFYYAGINERNNAFFIEKYVNGQHLYMNYVYAKGPAAVEQNQWYDIRFEVSGNTLRLYVDGELIKEAIDTDLSSGKFGIRSTEAFSKVDDFIVYKLDDTPYIPPSGEFAVNIDTDKTVYKMGELVRISVKVKGENVDVEDAKLKVHVEGNDQSFDIAMTRGVCVVSSADTANHYSGGATYCTWDGYFDTSLIASEEEEMNFIAYVMASIDGKTKEDKAKFEINTNIVEPENLVDVEITPTYRSVLPGESVTYKVTVKDNHPVYKCASDDTVSKCGTAYYNYNLVVSGLPFKDTLPHKITLAAGQEESYTMTVYTRDALEAAVETEVAQIETEIAEIEEEIVQIDTSIRCKDSDDGLNYYEKGSIKGSMPPGYIEQDMCMSDGRLRETYCDEKDENGDGYIGTSYLYDCPYGCEDGACIKEEATTAATTGRVVSAAHSTAQSAAVASAPQPVAQADTVTETAVIIASPVSASAGGGGKSMLVSAYRKPVVSNNYYGKTYSFTVKVNLQGQYNVRDAAYATLFVGKKYIIEETETVEEEPQTPVEVGDEYVVALYKGWNLVSLPGRFIKFDSQDCTNTRKLLGFVWLKDKQKYVTLKEAENILGSDFKQYLSENAFWVYSFEDCKMSISVRKYSSYEDISLVKGWNLIPVTQDMISQSLSSIGDCDYLKLYFWDAKEQEWSSFSENYVFYNSDLTKGFVTKVKDACTLGTAVILPPEMPED